MAKKVAGEYILSLAVELEDKELDKKFRKAEKKYLGSIKKTNAMEVKGASKHAEKVEKEKVKGEKKVRRKRGKVAKVTGAMSAVGGVVSTAGRFLRGVPVLGAVMTGIGATMTGAAILSRLASLDPNSIAGDIEETTGKALGRKQTASLAGTSTEFISKLESVFKQAGKTPQEARQFAIQQAQSFGKVDLGFLQQGLNAFKNASPQGKVAIASAYGVDPAVFQALISSGQSDLKTSFSTAPYVGEATNRQNVEGNLLMQREATKEMVKQEEIVAKYMNDDMPKFIKNVEKLSKVNIGNFKNNISNFETAVDSFGIMSAMMNKLDSTIRTTTSALKNFNEEMKKMFPNKNDNTNESNDTTTEDGRPWWDVFHYNQEWLKKNNPKWVEENNKQKTTNTKSK